MESKRKYTDNVTRNKIDLLCDYLAKNAPEHYPITNMELEKTEDYVKNGYLKMLAMILRQGDEVMPSQLELFRRIVAGVGTNNTVEDYLRMAMDVEIEEYLTFTSECKKLALKYRWVLDALLLTAITGKSEGQIELIAHFCEAYGIEKEELQYVTAMAKAILNMNVADYFMAEDLKTEKVTESVFRDYMYLISKKCFVQNEQMVIFQPAIGEEADMEAFARFQQIDRPIVKLKGVSLTLNGNALSFCDKEKVILEGCTFTGGKDNAVPITFQGCEQILIRNCKFHDFSSRTLELNDDGSKKNTEIVIVGCEFRNCTYEYYDSGLVHCNPLGGVFHKTKRSPEKFLLLYSVFENCGGKNETYHFKSAIISDIDCKVYHCEFKNCWHYSAGHKDPEFDKRTLFTPNSAAIDCVFEKSAKFN